MTKKILVAPQGMTHTVAIEVADEIRESTRNGLGVKVRWHGTKGIVLEGTDGQIAEALEVNRKHQIDWEVRDE